jgi:hypothetical protein
LYANRVGAGLGRVQNLVRVALDHDEKVLLVAQHQTLQLVRRDEVLTEERVAEQRRTRLQVLHVLKRQLERGDLVDLFALVGAHRQVVHQLAQMLVHLLTTPLLYFAVSRPCYCHFFKN